MNRKKKSVKKLPMKKEQPLHIPMSFADAMKKTMEEANKATSKKLGNE